MSNPRPDCDDPPATMTTSRVTVPALERLLGVEQRVLDHGFVRVVDYMGGDDAIVQAARVSYGKGTRRTSEDEGLIRYLMRQWHSTPFEMCEIKLHVKLPIFVARQWIRHRTANVNEYSARYSILDREFYVPAPDQMAAQSTVNRQGRATPMEGDAAEALRKVIADDADRSFAAYNWLLNEDSEGNPAEPDRPGLSRELARIGLGLNTYTQWYWKTDLHNLLHFLRLRADPHAQYEMRVYAETILAIVQQWVPVTYQAFLDYRLGAFALSATAIKLVQQLLAGEPVTFEMSGLTKREWDELDQKFALADVLKRRTASLG